MLGGQGNRLAGESQLLDFEWLSKQSFVTPKNQEAGNKDCVRVY
jgi:hypothetical protein